LDAQRPPASPDGREEPPEQRLDSWKEVAAYLRRGISTVQRWEQQEGLPVHRHPHEKRGSVYAFKSELDDWRQARSDLDSPAGHRRATLLVAIVGLTACVGVLVVRWAGGSKSPRPPSTIQLGLTEEIQEGPGSAVAISPDGRLIVYVAWRGGLDQLFSRKLEELEARPIAGTEHGRAPIFSPDGRWIAFFAGGYLRKVGLHGGSAVSICAFTGNPAGASWAGGTIVFATFGSGVLSVPEGGGQARAITSVAANEGEIDHRWPALAPDGSAVAFTIWSGASDTARIAVQALPAGQRRVLNRGSHPRWAGRDHVVFAWANALWAASFDAQRVGFAGPAVRVVDSVRSRYGGATDFDISQEGSLVYLPARAEATSVAWVDLQGRTTPILADGGSYSAPRISPDGTRLAVVTRSKDGARDIWIHDLRSGTRSQLTKEGASFDPVWTPDGREIAYASTRLGGIRIFRIRADGSSAPVHVPTGDFGACPLSWSPDGRLLAYHQESTSTGHDLWILSSDGRRVPFRTTPFGELYASFSPDGRALAYASNESGRYEVYVEPYPPRQQRWMVSTGGGRQPRWSPDGRALYYRADDGKALFRVAVSADHGFENGRPSLLFEGPFQRILDAGAGATYDVAPDGQRFVFVTTAEEPPPQVHILSHWLEALTPGRLVSSRPE
jgi:Tol biopolymer transport system component